MVPIKDIVVPRNNVVKQIEKGQGLPFGTEVFVDYINSKNKFPKVEYIALRPLIDGTCWRNKKVDFIRYIKKEYLIKLQRKQLVLIIDMGNEAFDPVNDIKFWKIINYNVDRYRLHKDYVWYLSSNTSDKSANYNCKFLTYSEHFWSNNIIKEKSVNDAFEETVNSTIKNFRKGVALYSSLHNYSKLYRHLWHYRLFKNKLDQYGMLSNPTIDFKMLSELQQLGESQFHTQRWSKTLPRSIDIYNKNGWTPNDSHLEKDFKILDRSAFHIVNETFVKETNYNITLISEKTFKTFARFIPSIILGINDTTKHLKHMGYIDMSFVFGLPDEWDKHPVEQRYELALNAVEKTCEKLNTLTSTQIIDWKFRQETKLKANYITLQNNKFICNQRDGFIQHLENAYENNT